MARSMDKNAEISALALTNRNAHVEPLSPTKRPRPRNQILATKVSFFSVQPIHV